VVNRIPVERLLTRHPDNKKRLEELQDILGTAEPKKATETTELEESPQRRVHVEPGKSTVSNMETVSYENREMVKAMRALVKHCTQKFRIFGKPCDCGQFKHLLELEGFAEETIPMVDNPDVYYRILEVGKELEPKVTLEAIGSGHYDAEYPKYAKLYRGFCKELGFDEGIDRDLIEKPAPGQYSQEDTNE